MIFNGILEIFGNKFLKIKYLPAKIAYQFLKQYASVIVSGESNDLHKNYQKLKPCVAGLRLFYILCFLINKIKRNIYFKTNVSAHNGNAMIGTRIVRVWLKIFKPV